MRMKESRNAVPGLAWPGLFLAWLLMWPLAAHCSQLAAWTGSNIIYNTLAHATSAGTCSLSSVGCREFREWLKSARTPSSL
ncbi:hypothetical protein V8C86DRAFT_2463531 [Haematococcus lacustris]